jgi:hypothetical protein
MVCYVNYVGQIMPCSQTKVHSGCCQGEMWLVRKHNMEMVLVAAAEVEQSEAIGHK